MSAWKEITSDRRILSWIKGYRIPFIRKPKQNTIPREHRWSSTEKSTIQEHLNKLLKMGAIRECAPVKNQFISKIFLTPKRDGSHRLILNLKSLNRFIQTQHFRLEDHNSVRKLLTPTAFLGSIDLKDAYYVIPVKKSFCKYLRFQFNNKIFEYTCLPFGLSTAPFVFTKLLKPVLVYLRKRNLLSNTYLDDFLLIGNSYTDCLKNISLTSSFLQKLGFFINWEKSVIIPNQKIKYLGFLYNTLEMSVSLPRDKQSRLQRMLSGFSVGKKVKIRDFARVVGSLISVCPAIRYSYLYTKQMERVKCLALHRAIGNFDHYMIIPPCLEDDIQWWKSHLMCSNSLSAPRFCLELFSDASRSGWGVVCGNKRSHGFWNSEDQKLHINSLELLAAFFSLKCFASDFKNCDIVLRIDNTTAIAYINKMGGTQHYHLHLIAKAIWQWCEERDIWIFASYVESSKNWADIESRRLSNQTEFELADFAFIRICNELFFPSVDLFASRNNAKVKKFVSWFPDPEAIAVDAFTLFWQKIDFYAFPPFNLVPRVLQKIITDKAKGVVVVPFWPSQAWYPLFLRLCVKGPIVFEPNSKLLLSLDRSPHPLHESLSLAAGLLWYKD